MKEVCAGINRVLAYIGGVATFVPVFCITADVISRYFFGKPILATSELVQIMVVLMIYLSFPHSLTSKSFIKIDIFSRLFSPKIMPIIDIFNNLAFLFIFGLICWQTALSAIESTKILEFSMGSVQIPLYPGKWALFLGILMVVVQIILNIGDRFIPFFSKKNKANTS